MSWFTFSRQHKAGIYVTLDGKGKRSISLGKLPEDDPAWLLDLVLAAARRTRSVTVLKDLRDANKFLR
jgi:hypothetical protein